MDKKTIIKHVVGVIIIVGGGLFGAKLMQKGNNKNQAAFFKTGNWQGGAPDGQKGGMRNLGGGLANGEVISKDAQSVTIKMRDGGSKNVLFSTSTKILKSTAGIIDDLKVGDTVMVVGKTNTDGSVNAESIQIQSAELALISPVKLEQKQ